MALGVSALLRIASIGALASLAVYSAYANAQDETSVSAEMISRAALGWSLLPAVILGVYLLNAALAFDSAKSFTPAMTLMIAYAIVFGFCAWRGPSDESRAGSTHLIFVPLILGVFSLPFFVFMADRAFNLARSCMRGGTPDGSSEKTR